MLLKDITITSGITLFELPPRNAIGGAGTFNATGTGTFNAGGGANILAHNRQNNRIMGQPFAQPVNMYVPPFVQVPAPVPEVLQQKIKKKRFSDQMREKDTDGEKGNEIQPKPKKKKFSEM